METESYDLIGDIHGEAHLLRDLLARLDYCERGGSYRHAHRRVIFLGDYIDRGPAVRETLHIIRAMVEDGAAVALCGNHELDVLLHDTPDGRGGWLRTHGGRHTALHAQTHREFADRPGEWCEWLRWFQVLPLYLELPGLCAVHACWDETSIERLRDRRLDAELLHAVADPQSDDSLAVRTLLRGREVPIPKGYHIHGGGRLLTEMRVRWWHDGRGATYREACINRHDLGPAIPVPEELDVLLTPPKRRSDKPIFIGHYWLPPVRPQPLTPTIACLDYSVAAGGPLVAYRWDGERCLSPAKFVFDPARLSDD